MRVAWYFSEPRRGEEQYEQKAKYLLVLYVKPYNKGFVISRIALFSSSLVLSFLHLALPENRIARESDGNNTNEIIQTFSKVSEFDRDQKVFALFLTEMLKVKCKDLNKSKFGSLGSTSSYLLCSKPVKPGHYRALRVLLTKYGKMAQ